ncbi:hypothetical protein J3E71DRAFT_238924 [Bipolaris maydis]|nr:hypothetical protein J3E71DRAFT_238924 [Bipolaris maydis]
MREPGFIAGTICLRIATATKSGQSCRILQRKYTSAPQTGCGSKKLCACVLTLLRISAMPSEGYLSASDRAKVPSPPPTSTTVASGFRPAQSKPTSAEPASQPGINCREDARKAETTELFIDATLYSKLRDGNIAVLRNAPSETAPALSQSPHHILHNTILPTPSTTYTTPRRYYVPAIVAEGHTIQFSTVNPVSKAYRVLCETLLHTKSLFDCTPNTVSFSRFGLRSESGARNGIWFGKAPEDGGFGGIKRNFVCKRNRAPAKGGAVQSTTPFYYVTLANLQLLS